MLLVQKLVPYVAAASGGKLLDVVTAIDVKVLPPLPSKLYSNSTGGLVFLKSSLVGAKSYAKAATSVVPPVAATADTGLAFGTSSKVVVPLLLVASSGSDVAVNTRLASLEIQPSELSLLIKSIVEPVSFLVVLVTTLLSTPSVMAEAMKKSVIGLGNQIKAVCAVASVLQKEVEALKLRSGKVHYNLSDDDDMDDDDDDGDAKDFSVYDDTFDSMMELWEMSGLVKSSHKLVCIMGKMYELDMFNTLGSKGSTNLKVSDNNVNSKVRPVMQRSTSVETINSEYQVKRNITSTNSLTVKTARPTISPFKFKTTNRPFGSVNTSSGDDTPFRIANTLKRTASHRRAADFSSTTANRLEEKANKKYRHIGRISVKKLTEKFNQITKEDLSKNTSV
ncbi:hypothetical protein G9A89_021364 [Geosiphon pyriformis]|nr:hypothetical protein G9A89_021364 [Geosiphon pyriformis]